MLSASTINKVNLVSMIPFEVNGNHTAFQLKNVLAFIENSPLRTSKKELRILR